jgi:hypothetical protein
VTSSPTRAVTRSPRLRRVAPALCAAAVAAAALWGAAGSAGASGTHGKGKAHGLVGYPSFLPKDTLHFDGDAVLVGTVRRPALTNQGDAVKVVTSRWSVLARVSGPEVPGEGLPYQAPSTTCTWTVTLSKATATVPVSAADFDSIDDTGQLFRPALVPGQPLPPRSVAPGQTVSFELRAAEPVGEGLMRWAPDGHHVVAKWDFVVEND